MKVVVVGSDISIAIEARQTPKENHHITAIIPSSHESIKLDCVNMHVVGGYFSPYRNIMVDFPVLGVI